MKVPVKIGISARHVHLTKETYDLLFDKELTVKNPLNQVGQFAANETVTLKNEFYEIKNVRIIGPLRSYDQVEISASDARLFKLNPPVRTSGDLVEAEKITIETPKGQVQVAGVIIANRHVHFSPEDAEKFGVVDKEPLKLAINGEKSGEIDVVAKVSSDGYFEVHLDTDDANAFLLKSGEEETLII